MQTVTTSQLKNVTETEAFRRTEQVTTSTKTNTESWMVIRRLFDDEKILEQFVIARGSSQTTETSRLVETLIEAFEKRGVRSSATIEIPENSPLGLIVEVAALKLGLKIKTPRIDKQLSPTSRTLQEELEENEEHEQASSDPKVIVVETRAQLREALEKLRPKLTKKKKRSENLPIIVVPASLKLPKQLAILESQIIKIDSEPKKPVKNSQARDNKQKEQVPNDFREKLFTTASLPQTESLAKSIVSQFRSTLLRVERIKQNRPQSTKKPLSNLHPEAIKKPIASKTEPHKDLIARPVAREINQTSRSKLSRHHVEAISSPRAMAPRVRTPLLHRQSKSEEIANSQSQAKLGQLGVTIANSQPQSISASIDMPKTIAEPLKTKAPSLRNREKKASTRNHKRSSKIKVNNESGLLKTKDSKQLRASSLLIGKLKEFTHHPNYQGSDSKGAYQVPHLSKRETTDTIRNGKSRGVTDRPTTSTHTHIGSSQTVKGATTIETGINIGSNTKVANTNRRLKAKVLETDPTSEVRSDSKITSTKRNVGNKTSVQRKVDAFNSILSESSFSHETKQIVSLKRMELLSLSPMPRNTVSKPIENAKQLLAVAT